MGGDTPQEIWRSAHGAPMNVSLALRARQVAIADRSFDVPHAAATFSRKPRVRPSGKESWVFRAQLFGRAFKAVRDCVA